MLSKIDKVPWRSDDASSHGTRRAGGRMKQKEVVKLWDVHEMKMEIGRPATPYVKARKKGNGRTLTNSFL